MTKVKIGDTIVLKEKISVLGEDYVGKEFTVTSIDDKFIYFKAGFGAGGMGHDKFDSFFKVIENNVTNTPNVEVVSVKNSKPTLKSRISNFFKNKK